MHCELLDLEVELRELYRCRGMVYYEGFEWTNLLLVLISEFVRFSGRLVFLRHFDKNVQIVNLLTCM